MLILHLHSKTNECAASNYQEKPVVLHEHLGDVLMKALFAAMAIALLPTAAFADAWILSNDESKIAFASIKKDTVGEIHHFTKLSGQVSKEGNVSVDIDLASVETWIDIRNERMIEHIFGDFATAELKANIDMDQVNAMKPGDMTTMDVAGSLTFLGKTLDIEVPLFIARISEDRTVVTTDEMIVVSTSDLNIDGGIDTLATIAKLSGITRVAPVTLRLVFNQKGSVS